MNKESILIVDDEPEIRNMLADMVQSFDFDCQTVENGIHALDLIRNNHFHIIISDISMPEMDGIELMNRAREYLPDMPFLIITGYSGDYSYERVVGSGANDFIRKPFTQNELKAKLSRILQERNLAEENKRLIKQQVALNEKMSTLIGVAADLSSELDFDRLFPLIIHKVTDAMAAERTSLYIIDWDNHEIWTKVAERVGEIRLPLGQGISGKVAETGEILNVVDAWELPYFNREFDVKHNFRTRAVLCMPINNRAGERIGVMQVINKVGGGRFNKDDEAFLKGLASQVAIALENAFLLEEVEISFESSIRTLSATVDAKHPLTAGHSQRVTEYALMIAREMNLDKKEQEIIKYAGLLHDIGKIGIPDHVLLKNGPFSPEEREEMNSHTSKTKLILENFHFPKALRRVPEVATYHHEKVNGGGYPQGLTGDELPLGSKILAAADVFDALTSRRDYPKYHSDETMTCEPMPLSKAILILKEESGSHFAPEVVEAFLRGLPRILLLYRGTHFPPHYVDETIRALGADPVPNA
ncbi:MAG: HD domain-containing phosphohydrolase [Pseudomonadota bacterium]